MKNNQLSAFSFQLSEGIRNLFSWGSLSLAKSQKPKAKSFSVARGLTLIELLVVMGIFSIISLVVLANHSRFNSSVLLGSLAYDIALSIREAQVYGLSVKQYGNNFQVGYGLRFAGASSYTFFADTNANKRYDSGVDSIVQTYTFGKGHTVKSFCGLMANGGSECSQGSGAITNLDIVFFRPEPDAIVSSNSPTLYSGGQIVITSPSGETRTITVASTGQISVTNP